MPASKHTDYLSMAAGLKKKYADDARLHDFDYGSAATRLKKFEEFNFRHDAIKTLRTRVLPRLQLAKGDIESTGLDVIIGRNWNADDASLSAPALRFQCANRHDALGAGGLPVFSKIAVFSVDRTGLRCCFEGADAETENADPSSSDEALVAWAVEQVVSNYYFELAKATYLMPG